MAHTTLMTLPANLFVGDNNAQLVGGDGSAAPFSQIDRALYSFDDTDEEAIVSAELVMPAYYAGGVLSADIFFAMASDSTNDIALDVFVEAVTPDVDTLDMSSAASWDSANSGTISVSGSTAGDLLKLTVTLTNKDSVVVGDLVRIGIRRDCDSGDDDAGGDLFIYAVEIWETT